MILATFNGLDLLIVLAVVVAGFVGWHQLCERAHRAAERDEELRSWLAGGRR